MKTLLILILLPAFCAGGEPGREWVGTYARRVSCGPGCTRVTCDGYHIGGGEKCYKNSCFPEDATVTLEDGSKGFMKNLKAGDRVKTVSNGQVIYTEVKTFLKRQPAIYSTYLNIKTTTGRSLTLAGSHQIFVSTNNDSLTVESRFAESVRKGDYLFTPGQCMNGLCSSLVTDVEQIVKKGAYVPLTDAGTLVVDDVYVSCYDTINHDIAHVLTTPARLFPWLLAPWQEDGYSPLVQWGKKLAQLVIPPSLQLQDLQTAAFAGVKSEL